jgi:TfoX/Sxy family transcriptional regulator of competence genes
MATDASFVDYVRDQIDAGPISTRKMFGEYALYHGEKVVALICDNQLFVKPTEAGRALLGEPVEAPPYPGAKPHFLIEELLDDRDQLSELIRVTAEELPAPKPKKAKASKKVAVKKARG